MPEFLDELIRQVRFKQDRMRVHLTQGKAGELDEEFKSLMKKCWLPLVRGEYPWKDVIAVDGSGALRFYASGAVLYVVRALALYGSRRFRELELDSFLSKAKNSDLQRFVNTKMECLEFKVGMKALEELDLYEGVLLIDGSLFGRMMHLPNDGPAEGMRDYLIEYFDIYYKLLNICRERSILLVGVSKDSRATYLRDYLLPTLFNNKFVDIIESIEVQDQKPILDAFDHIFDNPEYSLKLLKGLKAKYGHLLYDIELLIKEGEASRPDHQMIRNFTGDLEGYTVPIELSMIQKDRGRLLKNLIDDPEDVVKRCFKRSIREAKDEEVFISKAVEVLRRIPDFPAIVSFNVLFDRRDTPLRVDAPAWIFGLDDRVKDVNRHRRVYVNLDRVLSLLSDGYGGLKDYNIWLKRVDEEVRLARRTVDQLYTSILEKALGALLIHLRGYRRVTQY